MKLERILVCAVVAQIFFVCYAPNQPKPEEAEKAPRPGPVVIPPTTTPHPQSLPEQETKRDGTFRRLVVDTMVVNRTVTANTVQAQHLNALQTTYENIDVLQTLTTKNLLVTNGAQFTGPLDMAGNPIINISTAQAQQFIGTGSTIAPAMELIGQGTTTAPALRLLGVPQTPLPSDTIVTLDLSGNVINSGTPLGALGGGTSGNVPGALVQRDFIDGSFAAGTVTANLVGYHTGNVTGDVLGNLSGAASANVLKAGDTMTGALRINNLTAPALRLVTNTLSTPSDFVLAIDGSGNITASTVQIGSVGASGTSGNVPNTLVLRDSVGNFAAGTITAGLLGNVTGTVSGTLFGGLLGDVTGNVVGNLLGNVTGNLSGTVFGGLVGNVTGNVVGNLLGDVTGNVTGNLFGNVLGDVTGNVVGNVSGAASANVLKVGDTMTGQLRISDTSNAALVLTGQGTTQAPAVRLLNNPLAQPEDVVLAINPQGALTRSTATIGSLALATSGNVPNTLVLRDGSGNFATSALTLNTGTSGFAAINQAGDGNTGLYFPNAQHVALVADGLEQLVANPTGVGIGTTAPFTQVTVGEKFLRAGSTGTDSAPNQMYVQGRYAYVVNFNSNTLQVIDVSNQDSPMPLGRVTTAVNPNAIHVNGVFAYIVADSGSLQIVDVSNQSAPRIVGTVSSLVQPKSLFVQGSYAYVIANNGQNLSVIDVSDPSHPSDPVGMVSGFANAETIYVQGRYAYVTDAGNDLLQIVDLNDPKNPIITSSVSTGIGSAPRSVDAQGRYACVVCSGNDTVQVVDVGVPQNPVVVGTVTLPGGGQQPWDVFIEGRVAFVVTYGSDRIFALDVSAPSNPYIITSIATGDLHPLSFFVQGRYAYLINDTSNTLQIINLGGAYIQQLEAGGIEAATLAIRSDAAFGGELDVRGDVLIGRGLLVTGDVALEGKVTTTGGIRLYDTTSNGTYIGLNAPAAVTATYGLALPTDQGNAEHQLLAQSATLGQLTWLSATSSNQPTAVVLRNASGNFSAQTIIVSGLLGNVTGNVVGNVLGNVTGNVVGNLLGDVTGNVVGDLSGAASANVLKIGDTMTGTLRIMNTSAPALQLLTNAPAAAQDYLLAIDSSGNVTKITSATGLVTNGTSGNVPNALVLRDGSGNFAAGIITANLVGDVTGDVSGQVTGNLLGNVTGNVVGNVFGDVTGNVTGNLVGNVLGNVTGNVVGNLLGDVTGNVVGNVLGAASANVLKIGDTMTGTLRILNPTAPALQLLTNSPTSTQDYLLAIDSSGNVTQTQTAGGLLTAGTSTNIPNTLVLRDGSGNFAASIITANLLGDVTGDVSGQVTGNLLGNVTGNVVGNVLGDVTGNVTGNLVGNVLGNVTGNVVGNLLGDVTGNVVGNVSGAASANVLKIGDTMTGTLRILNPTAPALQLLTNSPASTQDYLLAIDSSGNVTQTQTAVSLLTTGTSANIPNTLVLRDDSGNFAASIITANLVGDVTGDVSGQVTGNLLGNVTGNVVGNVLGDVTGNVTGNLVGNVLGNVTGNVVGNLLGDVTGNVVGNVSGAASANVLKIGDTMTGTLRILNPTAPALQLLTNSSASTQDYLLAIDSSGNVTKAQTAVSLLTTGTSTNIPNTLVLRDSSGNFAASIITANLVGDVTGDVSGQVTGNLLGNVTGNVVGNVLGDVTGNVTGNLVGNVLGNVTGNVVGNLLGDVTGNVVGNVSGAASANVLKIGDTMTGQLRVATIAVEPAVVITGQATTQAPALRLLQNPLATDVDNFLTIDSSGNVTQSATPVNFFAQATSGNVPNTLIVRDSLGNFAANGIMAQGLDLLGTSTFTAQVYNLFATVQPQNILYVHKGLLTAPNQFSSVKSALAAITDATATNRYLISVAPGIYAEDNPVTLKSYVSIVGANVGTVTLQTQTASEDLLITSTASPLVGCYLQQLILQGATGAGKAALYVRGGELTAYTVHLGTNDIGIRVDNSSTGQPVLVTAVVGQTVPSAIINTVFSITDGAYPQPAGVLLSEFLSGTPTANSTVVSVNGPGAFFFAGSLSLGSPAIPPATGSTFLTMSSGASVQVGNASVNGYETAFNVASGFVGSRLTLFDIAASNNTHDLIVSDQQVQGSIKGQFDNTKVTIDPAVTQLSVLFTAPADGGLTTLAPLRLGRSLDVVTNVSPALNDGTSLGVVAGGLVYTTPASLVVTVSAGNGYLMQTTAGYDNLKLVEWATTTTTVVPNSDNFISINNAGLAQVSLTQPSSIYTIPLGKVRASSTGALFLQAMADDATHTATKLQDSFVNALGPIYILGSIATAVNLDNINVSGGQYVFGTHQYAPVGGTPISWQAYLGGTTNSFVVTQTAVDYQQYDLNGVLTPIPANYYARHGLYVTGGVDMDSGATTEQYALVYSQTVYSSLPLAEVGDLPTQPSTWSGNIAPIASLIVQNNGAVRIAEILDERPRPGYMSRSVAGISIHGNLQGLTADDHPQYLLGSGARAMAGSLQMAGNSLTNVSAINGVVIEAHAARHLPNGADPLAVGTPVDVSALANDAGTANSFSRADHRHFHGNLPGGLLHDVVNTSTAGFMRSADYITLLNATSNNTPSTLVKRDGSGDFAAGTITAALIGNVTGNVVGSVTGQVTGSLLGNVTGNVVGNLLGNVTGNVVGNVSGAASANVLKVGDTMTGQLRINDPSLASLVVTGHSTATAPALRLFGNLAATTTDNFLAIDGSGNVSQTTTQVGALANATSSNVANTLVLRDANGNFAAGTITAGLIGNVTGNVSGQVTGSLLGNVTGNVVGNLLGNVTGNVVGNVSGAASANVLKVGDTMTGQLRINDPTLASLVVTGHSTATAPALRLFGNLTATTTDNFLAIDGSGNVSQTTTQVGALANATSSNVANTLVLRDANGNFAAGTITAGLIGNVTGNVSGQVTGSLLGNVTGNVVGNLLGNVTGNVVGNVSGAASANVLKVGDTMTGQLRINDPSLASLVVTGHSTAIAPALRMSGNLTASSNDSFLAIDGSGNVSQTTTQIGMLANATSSNVANTLVLRDNSGNFATSAITLNAGTTGAAALNFAGSAGTGLYSPGTNQLALVVTNAQKLYANSTGVGIGTTAPFTQLTVGGTALFAGSTGRGGSGLYGVFVQGNYAYVADGGFNTLDVIDVSNPNNPRIVASVAGLNGPVGVYVQGYYVYVTNTGDDTIQIFDISNPSNPLLRSTLGGFSSPRSIYVQGCYAYVGNAGAGTLQVVDVSNPAYPAFAGSIGGFSGVLSLYVDGYYVYGVTSVSGTIEIVDARDAYNLQFVGNLGGLVTPDSVFVQGNYAYIVDQGGTLSIIDVSNPSNPALAGSLGGFGTLTTVYVQGRYAYAIDLTANNLVVFDVSDPTSPVVVRTLGGFSTPFGLFVQGRYAYVSNAGNNMLQIVDLGGAHIQQLGTGDIQTGTLASQSNLVAGNNLTVVGGTAVGTTLQAVGDATFGGRVTVGDDLLLYDVTGGQYVGLKAPTTVNTSYTLTLPTDQGTAANQVLAQSPTLGQLTWLNATSSNTPNTLVLRDSNNNFAAGTVTANLIGNVTGNVVGNVLGNVTGNVVGNVSGAASANVLKIGDTMTGQLRINDPSLASLVITGHSTTTAPALRLTGNLTATTVDNFLAIDGSGNVSQTTLQVSALANATSSNVANTLVLRDANGNFAAGTITAGLIGNVTGNVSGNVTGSLLGNVTGNVVGNLLGNVTGNVVGNVSGAASANVLKIGDTMTGQLRINDPTLASLVVTGHSTTTAPALRLTGNLTATNSDNFLAIDGSGNVAQTTLQIGALANATSSNVANTLVLRDNSGNFATSALTLNAGTTGAAALNFAGSAGTGLYLPGTNQLALVANNAQTLYANSTGVGIGTSAPFTQLTVGGTALLAGTTGTVVSGPQAVYVQGRYAYVTDTFSDSFSVIDVSDVNNPAVIGVMSVGDQPKSVFVQGRYAYVLNDASNSLLIIDVSNPSSPKLIGTLNSGLSSPQAIYVQGTYAYIANSGNGTVSIVDVGVPDRPTIVAAPVTGAGAYSVYVQGRYAYVANSSANTLTIVDVSNPSAPLLAGTVTALATPYAVAVQGRYAYVTNGGTKVLSIIDVSNPSTPIKVADQAIGSAPFAVSVQGRYAYVTNALGFSILVIDVSIPTSPVLVRTITGLSVPFASFIQGRYAYVANNGTNALQIVDLGGAYMQQLETGGIETGTLATRENVAIGNDLDVRGGAVIGRGLQVTGDVALDGKVTVTSTLQLLRNASAATTDKFLTINGSGNVTQSSLSIGTLLNATSSNVANTLALRDNAGGFAAGTIVANQVGVGTTAPFTQLTVGGSLTSVGTVTGLSGPSAVYVQGRYAYVANIFGNSLSVIDVSNPSNPVSLGSVLTGIHPQSVYVQGRYAYVANYNGDSLSVIDISNPSSPKLVQSVSTGGLSPLSSCVQGRYAYVVNSSSHTMSIIDVSNPNSPLVVGSVPTGGSFPFSVYVQERYAYIANFSDSLLSVIDVSNPSSPQFVGSALTGGSSPFSVYVQGRYAYVANYGSDTMSILDVSNPSSPVSVGTVATGTDPYCVYVQGRYAYVANFNGNTLSIIDVSDPSSPVVVRTVGTGANPQSVYVQGRYAYVVNNGANNLQIIDLGGAYIQQLEAGGLETGTLATRSNVAIGNNLDVKGGAVIGRNLDVNGQLTAMNAAGNTGTELTSPLRLVNLSSGAAADNVLAVDVSGNVTQSTFGSLLTNGTSSNVPNTLVKRDSSGNFAMSSLTLNAGTAALAALNFAGSAGTGLYSPGTDQLALSANSAQVLYANATGVGIGTATPIAQLTVGGNALLAGSVGTAASPNYLYVQGRYAYVGNSYSGSAAVQSIDFSNPASPTVIGALPLPNGAPTSLYVQGRYAYVVTVDARLYVIDMSNQAGMLVVGSVAVNNLAASVYVQGRYAYVASVGANSVQVVDVSNPVSPVVAGVVTGFNNPRGITVQGQYAYVGNFSGNTLQAIDISNPAQPRRLATAVTQTNPIAVAVQGRYAYVLNYSQSSMQIFDMSNPSSIPAALSSIATVANPLGLSVQGRYAYVASNGSNLVQVFDISNPQAPVFVRNVSVGTSGLALLAVQGRYLYVCNRVNNALAVIDLGGAYIQQLEAGGIETGTLATRENLAVGNDLDVKGGTTLARGFHATGSSSILGDLVVTNTNMVIEGSATTTQPPRWLVVQGRYAYVLNSTGGSSMLIFDVSSTTPVLVGTQTGVGTTPRSVAVQGRYAYVVSDSATIVVVDISNPSSPFLAGSAGIPNVGYSIYVQGRYAYIISNVNALYIVDISNPSSPQYLVTYSNSLSNPANVWVQGRYAYVANNTVSPNPTITVVDVSNPTAPVLVSNYFGTSSYRAITVQGRYAYAIGFNGMDIIDIKNPASLTLVGSFASGVNTPNQLSVQGRYAYITNFAQSTVSIVDVSNPASPLLVNTLRGFNGVSGVQVQGRFAYVCDFSAGKIEVVDLGGAYIQQLEAGGIETGTLATRSNVAIGNDLDVKGGMGTGRSVYVNGQITAINATGSGTGTATTSPLRIVSIPTGTFGTTLGLDVSGNVGVFSSSQRFKENIVPLTNESDLLYSLTPVKYDYKPEYGGGKGMYGFIAEDLAQVYPTIINYDEHGLINNYIHSTLHALTIKELQKHKKTLDSHTATLGALLHTDSSMQTELTIHERLVRDVLITVASMQAAVSDLRNPSTLIRPCQP